MNQVNQVTYNMPTMLMSHKNDNLVMFVIMILSGLFTTMNIWTDSIRDVRISLNDIYMILLMCGWMFLFMGIYYLNTRQFILGIILVVINFICIRKQFLISAQQYITGMIPHHSMAILMSKRLLENYNNISVEMREFVSNIINTQQQEIYFMKSLKL